MIPSALPLVAKSDFPAFQQLIRELLAMSYDEWADDHRRAVAYRQSRNRSIDIPVRPDEFAEWLKNNDQIAHLEMLFAYAEYKAASVSRPARRTAADPAVTEDLTAV